VFPIEEIESSFKGLLDSSKNAVKAVHDKARELVSQNQSQRFNQDGESHLDMVYITESIIAVGFPGADSNSSSLGFLEANYQNLVEELITFCEAEHPGRYKIFNLCSENLYDTSLLHDKVARFPIQGSHCPPLQLVSAFCEAAYSWLKEGLENVVVVHCKGPGMARTGLMISCLLLHLKFYPTAEESMNHYNLRRSALSKGVNLPSQQRYVKYYEKVLRQHHGIVPTTRRCALRSIRLINCPTWIRPAVTVSDHQGLVFRSMKHPSTRSMLTEELWLGAIRKGEFVFELPDDGRAATVEGDFEIQFQCYHADFSCWLNTSLMDGALLRADDLDGFDKIRQEAIDFQIELDLVDTNSSIVEHSAPSSVRSSLCRTSSCTDPTPDEESKVFSDSEGEEESSTYKLSTGDQDTESSPTTTRYNTVPEITTGILNRLGMGHLRDSTKSASSPRSAYSNIWRDSAEGSNGETVSYIPGKVIVSGTLVEDDARREAPPSDFQALAAASAHSSLFTFVDEDDYESDFEVS
jgi:phosphatidylinositol-3,4,5-trisphosphate 3-phosphatase/dual-specificity protein phosphatase PTEN